MMQTFEFPNLLDVSAGHAILSAAKIGSIPSVVCHGDPVVGDYYRVIPEQDLTSWPFVNITDVSAAGDVPVGTRMAISLLMRVGGEPYHAYPNLLLGQGIDSLLGSIAYSHEDIQRRRGQLRGRLHCAADGEPWHHARRLGTRRGRGAGRGGVRP